MVLLGWSRTLSQVLLIICFAVSLRASSLSDPYYIAGVVEFQPASSDLTSSEQLDDNLLGYLYLIDSFQAVDTDIIVFPEGTLNNYEQLTYVPDPKDTFRTRNVTICDNSEYADFLQVISCRAIALSKYIVINIIEKEDCTKESQAENNDSRPCAPSGLNLYNTNVVFDRKGIVVSRYRKWNLYQEPWNVTDSAELETFVTDFGVTFGHFICFDILFYTPASELVKAGITDFIFPNMWFSQLPFLTGVQIQQSWAYANDVNFLSAGASNPSIGNTGSGIYAGKQGSLISVMNSSPVRKLYVSKVMKRDFARQNPTPALQLQIRNKRAVKTSTLNGLYVKRDSRIDKYTTAPLDPSQPSAHLCHESFCCDFTVAAKTLNVEEGSSFYQYRYAVFSGLRPYSGMEPIYTRICTIFACMNESLESCALAFNDTVEVSPQLSLESVTIEADFTATEKLLLMPNSVDAYLMPLTVDSFHFNITDKGGMKNVRYELLTPRDNLMNFGIYGNYFHGYSSAMSLLGSKAMLMTVSIVIAIRSLFT